LRRAALAAWTLCACGHAAPAPPAHATLVTPPRAAPVNASAEAGAGAPVAPVFLGEVALESPLGAALPARLADQRPLALTLHASQAMSSWGEIGKRTKPKTSTSDAFAFVYDGYPVAHDPATAAERKATFVIDYDEPSVKTLHDRIAQKDKSPSIDAITAFVAQFIDKKDLDRGFDVASVVATRHEGDCTEHAVLLAALARSFGYPARVVLGFALVDFEGHAFAMGHAWVETFRDGAWRLADAALPAEVHARYLPLTLLQDESAAFERAWMSTLDLLTLKNVVVE